MNEYQNLWWDQAKSDYHIFEILLKRDDVGQCQLLHYLQMATEKLAKAYLWRHKDVPPKSHKGLVYFFRLLLQNCDSKNQDRIAELFKFTRFIDFQTWVKSALTIVYDVEHLAPSLANNGPNPEYPWPHDEPAIAPANHDFQVWKDLDSGKGRRLLKVIEIAIRQFDEFASL